MGCGWSTRPRKRVFLKLRPTSARSSSTHFRRASSTRWLEERFCRSLSSHSCSAPPVSLSAQCGATGCRHSRGSLAEVMFRYTSYVMYVAPLGVGAAMAVTVGSKGIGVLFGLGKLIATMYAAQVVFVVAVLGTVVAIFRIPCAAFCRAVQEPFLIAFSTASSEAALAARPREHGAIRRPETYCRFRDADRLQLQPRWNDFVSVAGECLCCAGRGNRDDASASSS